MVKPIGACVLLCMFVLAGLQVVAQDRGLVRVPAPVGPKGEMRELYSASHALLIGVSRYQDPTWGPLDSIENELKALETALRAQGFTVRRVNNPTRAELGDAVKDFIDSYGYTESHRLFFFFAGHGYTLDNGENGFFVARDAPDPTRDEAGFRRAALSMRQVATWAQDITAKHALFAFDSCFSGSIFRTRDAPQLQRIGVSTVLPVREFLAAGTANQTVPARSVFTPVVVRALNGAADLDGDGYITGTELGIYVQGEVIAYKTGQTPQAGKIRDLRYDQGEIVFLPPTNAAALPVPAIASDPAPRTAAVDARAETAAIVAALYEYRLAYEARDLDRLLRVFPALPDPAGVKKALEEAREVLIGMTPPQVRLTSATEATATTRLNQDFVPKIGTGRRAPTREVTFTLHKVGGQWLIVGSR